MCLGSQSSAKNSRGITEKRGINRLAMGLQCQRRDSHSAGWKRVPLHWRAALDKCFWGKGIVGIAGFWRWCGCFASEDKLARCGHPCGETTHYSGIMFTLTVFCGLSSDNLTAELTATAQASATVMARYSPIAFCTADIPLLWSDPVHLRLGHFSL